MAVWHEQKNLLSLFGFINRQTGMLGIDFSIKSHYRFLQSNPPEGWNFPTDTETFA